jgi:arylsulfatase A-like enzyme
LLAYVDDQLAQLFASIEASETGRDTQWVITSDHGEGLGNHGYTGHGRYLYDEQLRVPLILYPGNPATPGTRIAPMVRTVDLHPTVVELAGLEAPKLSQQMEGVSLVRLLEAPEAPLPIDYVYAQRRPSDEARAKRGWEDGLVIAAQNLEEKYIFYEARADEYFDLTHDPGERVNLASERPTEAEALRRWLLETYSRVRAARPGEEQQIQPEFLEELRALGYVE